MFAPGPRWWSCQLPCWWPLCWPYGSLHQHRNYWKLVGLGSIRARSRATSAASVTQEGGSAMAVFAAKCLTLLADHNCNWGRPVRVHPSPTLMQWALMQWVMREPVT
jgi:hypothetical protein